MRALHFLGLLLLLFAASCSLDKSNPLDSDNVPPDVSNLDISCNQPEVTPKWVQLTWASVNTGEVAGYYVYRSFSPTGRYQWLMTVPNSQGTSTITCRDTQVTTGRYYYKVSSFYLQQDQEDIDTGGQNNGLEGHLSRYATILVR